MTARPSWPGRRRARGFSLLEVLVAFAIMAMALTVLYRAMGGSVSSMARVGTQQQAALLAQSLLDMHEYVGPDGWNQSGEAAGMQWRVQSQLFTQGNTSPTALPLHQVQLDIQWPQGQRQQTWTLTTLLPQRRAIPGEVR